MTLSVVLRYAAALLFAVATLVALGIVDVRDAAAFIPAGLACWVLSTL